MFIYAKGFSCTFYFFCLSLSLSVVRSNESVENDTHQLNEHTMLAKKDKMIFFCKVIPSHCLFVLCKQFMKLSNNCRKSCDSFGFLIYPHLSIRQIQHMVFPNPTKTDKHQHVSTNLKSLAKKYAHCPNDRKRKYEKGNFFGK